MRTKLIIAGALLLVAVAVACSRSKAAAQNPLPETGVPGWSKAGATRVFDAADLWKYIDGDAEKYIRAGVKKTFTANYRHQSGTEAVADVHVMSAAEGAQQLFESEPASGSSAVNVGDAGRLYGASLVFRRNACLVRLVAYDASPQIGQALVELAKALDAKLASSR